MSDPRSGASRRRSPRFSPIRWGGPGTEEIATATGAATLKACATPSPAAWPLLVLASCDGGSPERGEARLAEADLIEELTAIGYVGGAEPAGPRSGVSLHDIDRVQPGLNLFTSGHGSVAVLMDMDGVVLNEWRSRVKPCCWQRDSSASAR